MGAWGAEGMDRFSEERIMGAWERLLSERA
jgi:hypothetical protein